MFVYWSSHRPQFQVIGGKTFIFGLNVKGKLEKPVPSEMSDRVEKRPELKTVNK